MLRKNLMSALFAAMATGALITGYNAFIHKSASPEKSATGRLSSYLSLDKTTQESKDAENNVVGTDNGTTTATAPSVAVTETPSSDAAQSSSATTTDTTAPTPTTTTTTSTAPSAAQSGKAETVYTVKDGDTYGCIAEKYYGSYEHYTDVMAANPVNQTGFGEYSLYVGAQLVLPAVAKENLKPASSLCQ